MILGFIALLARVAAPVMAAMPSQAQAVAVSRANLVVFLFWFSAFALLGLTGAWAFSASFAVLGWTDRAAPHPVIPVLGPFAEEFWAIVAARQHLSAKQRGVIWLRHVLFGVALMLTAGVGMLMTLGLPKAALWPHLLVGMVVILLLGPARSDRRIAARQPVGKPPADECI
ncbi:MAG TPA: hypothetical protein VM221_11280 [Armatimonadota bacterium]|nr:hypothetical protein [Armatimonadota bacterium]